MTRLFIAALGSALVGVGAYSSFDGPAPATEAAFAPPPVSAAAPASKRPAMSTFDRDDYLAQSYGTVCETPRGECTVSPKPINGLCTCGDTPGKIIR